jgi:predicted  nucleic acid-binding Zn-ribbon protein
MSPSGLFSGTNAFSLGAAEADGDADAVSDGALEADGDADPDADGAADALVDGEDEPEAAVLFEELLLEHPASNNPASKQAVIDEMTFDMI